MRTPVCDQLGIEFPILAFSHCRDVVAAVTNAGGLGVLGATAHSPQQLEVDLAWIDEQVKGKPYGVDLLLPAKFSDIASARPSREDVMALLPPEQRQFVDDILERYDVPALPDGVSASAGRLSVSPQAGDELLDVAFRHEGVKLVASALGAPSADLVGRAHGLGVKVAALAGTVEHARRSHAMGVDLIIAQGTEAGGHTGQIATMVLVPQVVDAVAPTPVLGAGGIGNGRQVAAAMALGAQGVWCGSVWLTTEEAETGEVVKQKFLAAGSGDTVRSRSLTGKPARMLRTAWTDEWDRADAPDALPMPLQTLLTAGAQQRIGRAASQEGSGAQQLATYFVGQVVGSMNKVRPAREVVQSMIAEYLEVAERFAGQVRD